MQPTSYILLTLSSEIGAAELVETETKPSVSVFALAFNTCRSCMPFKKLELHLATARGKINITHNALK